MVKTCLTLKIFLEKNSWWWKDQQSWVERKSCFCSWLHSISLTGCNCFSSKHNKFKDTEKVIPVYVSGHAKVSNLDHPARSLGSEQTIPGCYVPVDEAILLHILATLCDVHSTHQQVLHHEGRWPFLHHTPEPHATY